MIASLTGVALFFGAGALPGALAASPYKVDSRDNIVAAANTIAHDLMSFYKGNQSGETPGILAGPPPNGPYYWGNAAGFWSTFIDYWHVTGDDSFNDVITQAILHQRGPDDNFLTPNWTASLGNDDQCIWALTTLQAAENQFPNPKDGPEWITIAQNAFETMLEREKSESACGGGLRWQIPLSNNGYNYKETFSNGCYFNLGARLFRYTGNSTYRVAAEKVLDWMLKVKYIDTETWVVYNGGHTEKNCTDVNKALFSYAAANIVEGAAFFYNQTAGTSNDWKTRLDNLLDSTLQTFFTNGVAFEVACEERDTCTVDMVTFKGYLHRQLAVTAQVAPYTAGKINPLLASSAKAAAAQCTGGKNGRMCGFNWADGTYSILSGDGLAEQMSTLGAVGSLLVPGAKEPGTNGTKTTEGGASGTSGGSGTSTGSAPGVTKPSSAGRSGVMGWWIAVAGLAMVLVV